MAPCLRHYETDPNLIDLKMKSPVEQNDTLLLRLARGSRLQGFILKVLVALFVVAGFQLILRLLGLVAKYHLLKGSAEQILVHRPMALLLFAEPVLWVWFLIVPLFGAVRMYARHKEEPQDNHNGA